MKKKIKEKRYKKGDILTQENIGDFLLCSTLAEFWGLMNNKPNLTISILDWLLVAISHLKQIREQLNNPREWEINYYSKNPTDTFTLTS